MKILRTWKTFFLKLAAAGKWRSNEQAPGSSFPVVLTQYQVKTSWQEKFTEVLSEHAFSSLGAPGNIMAEAYYENGDSCTMWTIERWRSNTFYQDNQRSNTAKTVDALTKSALTSPVDVTFIKDLGLLSKEVYGNASTTSDPSVTIMLMIDVQAGTESYFKSINHELMEALRSEPGVLLFQFGQVFYYSTRFIVWKKFRNWDAFQYHLKEPSLERVMKFLQNSVKEPPFEKGYYHLIPLAPK